MKTFKRDKDGEAVIYGHVSSETTCPGCERPLLGLLGVILAGRAWLHFAGKRDHCLEADWYWLRRKNDDLAFRFEVGGGDDEDGIDIRIAIPFLLTLYLSAEGFCPWLIRREIELRYSFSRDVGAWGSLWWNLWMTPNEWNSKEPKWRRGSFDPADFVLGRPSYSKAILSEHFVTIRMPEGEYHLAVDVERATWKRPRWPFPIVRVGCDVTSATGVPIPGKGENAWDCGEDALFGTGFDTSDPVEAGELFVRKVMEYREKRGGGGWLPEEVKAA